MSTTLKYNDPENWLKIVKEEVRHSYKIPLEIKKDICVDVGTNVGAFPILNHKKFNNIYSFEASSYCFEQATKNIAANNIKNVHLYNLAAYKDSDQILKLRQYREKKDGQIVMGKEMSGNSSIAEIAVQENKAGFDFDNEYEEVKSISLEGIKKLINSNKINYLKCDIECGEYDFLMNKDLSDIDFIAMELHCHLGDEKVRELVNHLLKYFTPYHSKIGELPEQSKNKNFHLTLNLMNKRIKPYPKIIYKIFTKITSCFK